MSTSSPVCGSSRIKLRIDPSAILPLKSRQYSFCSAEQAAFRVLNKWIRSWFPSTEYSVSRVGSLAVVLPTSSAYLKPSLRTQTSMERGPSLARILTVARISLILSQDFAFSLLTPSSQMLQTSLLPEDFTFPRTLSPQLRKFWGSRERRQLEPMLAMIFLQLAMQSTQFLKVISNCERRRFEISFFLQIRHSRTNCVGIVDNMYYFLFCLFGILVGVIGYLALEQLYYFLSLMFLQDQGIRGVVGDDMCQSFSESSSLKSNIRVLLRFEFGFNFFSYGSSVFYTENCCLGLSDFGFPSI